MNRLGRILLVEDDPKDVELTQTALDEYHFANEVVVASDGEQALDYLYYRGRYAQRERENPAVVLLDLKLPKVDGLEVLRRIRADQRTRVVPVLVLTSSKEEEDLRAAYDLGANGYVRKPVSFSEFSEAVHTVGLFWLLLNQPPPDPPP